MDKGLLAVWVDVPDAIKPDFDRWYDEEHLPERAAVPGFESAIRYEATDAESKGNMAIYELESLKALDHPQYRRLKESAATELGTRVRSGWQNHERKVYSFRSGRTNGGSRHSNSKFLFSVREFFTDDAVDKARRWFDEEHAERQLTVPGVRFYQGWEPVDGEFHFLNLWGLDDPRIIQTDAWSSARHSPWRDQLASARLNSIRQVYRRRTTLIADQGDSG